MSTQKLLLPYNFSAQDRRALAFTIDTFASRGDVEVTLFHAYPLLPAIDVQDTDVTERLRGSMSYLYSKISELESDFHAVTNELIQGGFKPERVRELFKPRKKDVAAEIMELHGSGKFDCIVLSRRAGKIGRFFTGSVHLKLISALKKGTLCIVT
jgi:hypothetical protein